MMMQVYIKNRMDLTDDRDSLFDIICKTKQSQM